MKTNQTAPAKSAPLQVVAGLNDSFDAGEQKYHVQTEADPNRHRVFTHVFLGGAVVASRQSSFAELVSTPLSQTELRGRVQRMIRTQHQSILVDLASGRILDPETLGFAAIPSTFTIPEAAPLPNLHEEPDFVGVSDEIEVQAEAPVQVPVKTVPKPMPKLRGVSGPSAASVENLCKTLEQLQALDGFLGASLVDVEVGLILAHAELPGVDIESAGAANAEVMRAKNRALQQLGIEDQLEDILITLGRQYHLMRPLASEPDIVLYLMLERGGSDLGLARHLLATVANNLKLKDAATTTS